MSSLERLPPDQRAVLALVLQRGRSYDEIANLLAIDRAAVRDRALAALDALGPTESRVPAERRALITDYLLGQLPDRVREQVRERLASNPGERAWARVLAGELSPLARDPLPEIPTSEVASAPEPAPEPAPAAAPAPASEATPAAEPTQTDPAAAATTTPPLGSGRGLPRPVPGERSSSRRGGGLLLAIAALILVVVLIVILATSGGSSPKKSGTTNAGTPTTTSTPTTATGTGTSTTATPHVIAQINLRPPNSSSKAAGIVEVVTEGKLTGVIVVADHLTPNTTHNAYAVWLSNPGGASQLLGYVSPAVGKSGDLKTSGRLPANAASFKDLLVTLETTESKTTPGPTVLAGILTTKKG